MANIVIKVDLISGFLGAGKTTLIKHLLGTIYKNENVVLIENEFGEIGIDGGFLKESGIEIREMNSGCICCSLVGDFATSLKEVVETYHPERIIIEPSGVGKLSDVEKAVNGVKDELGLEIAFKVVVIDITKCKMYSKNFGEFYKNQIENANTIIFSRTDIAKEEKTQEALSIVKEMNGSASIITTPVTELDTEVILKSFENKNTAKDMMEEVEHHHHHHEHDDNEECCCGHEHHHHHEHDEDEECCEHEHHHHHEHDEDEECCEHEHHHHHEHDEDEECCCGHDHHHHGEHHHHHADDVFTSWGMETAKAYSKEKLEEILKGFDNCSEGTILRSKGIVKAEDSSEWLYFDYVPGQIDIRYGSKDSIGKICVIAAGYTEEQLKEFFN